jgi:hypothetical protein
VASEKRELDEGLFDFSKMPLTRFASLRSRIDLSPLKRGE